MAFSDYLPWKPQRENLSVKRRQDYPSDPFAALQKEMRQLFSDFQRSMQRVPFGGAEEGWNPCVNIEETEKEFVVTAELPGLEEKNIDVSLTNNTLTLKGEKSEEREVKEGKYVRTERVFGTFHRVVELPHPVLFDKTDATFKNGVLRIVLPKAEPAEGAAKKINIKG